MAIDASMVTSGVVLRLGDRRTRRGVVPDPPRSLALTRERRLLLREGAPAFAPSLLRHLDATEHEAATCQLEAASASAFECGRVAAELGLSLSQTAEGFLRFRAAFHHELAVAAGRRACDAAETAQLLEASERAMDRLLVAMITGYGPSSRAAAASAISVRIARPQDIDDGARRQAALRDEDKDVVDEIGGLLDEGVPGLGAIDASTLRRGVVLCRDQDFGRLFGDLPRGRVHAALDEARRIRADGTFTRSGLDH
jgi:hypothetical protein